MDTLSLWDAAAERLALETGLPVSQALLRVRGLDVEADTTLPLFTVAGAD